MRLSTIFKLFVIAGLLGAGTIGMHVTPSASPEQGIAQKQPSPFVREAAPPSSVQHSLNNVSDLLHHRSGLRDAAARYRGASKVPALSATAEPHAFARPDPLDSLPPSETMFFESNTQVTSTGLDDMDPSMDVASDGVIYLAYVNSAGSLMWTKSTDGGGSWSAGLVIESTPASYSGAFYPIMTVYGSGASTVLYVTYMRAYTPTTDYTDYDAFMAISQNAGSSFLLYTVGNSIRLEISPQVSVDAAGVAYLTYAFVNWDDPPWWDFSCSTVQARSDLYLGRSFNNGTTWDAYVSMRHEDPRAVAPIAAAVSGQGATSVLHIAFSWDASVDAGTNYDVRYMKVTNAGGTPSFGPDVVVVASGSTEIIYPGCLIATPAGNPQLTYQYEYTGTDNDIYYARSTDGGVSFLTPVPIDASTADQLDQAIGMDDQGNAVIAYRGTNSGTYDIWMRATPDLGATWTPAIRVNSNTAGVQAWPWVAIYSNTTQRRVTIAWMDSSTGTPFDIMATSATQYKNTIQISVSPGGNPFGGTAACGFTFFGNAVSVPRNEGTFTFFHDPATTVSAAQLTTGSTTNERWIYSTSGGWSTTPGSGGNTYSVPYWNQLNVRFLLSRVAGDLCPHAFPVALIPVSYEAFGPPTEGGVTDTYYWANRGSTYNWGVTWSPPGQPNEQWSLAMDPSSGTIDHYGDYTHRAIHQFRPLIHLVGPTCPTNTATGTPRWYLGVNAPLTDGCGDITYWVDCNREYTWTENTTLGWRTTDPRSWTVTGYFEATINYRNTRRVIVTTNPVGGTVYVDATPHASPDTLWVEPPAAHTISVDSLVTTAPGVRWVFDNWSDGGARTHTIQPISDTVFTANYHREFLVTVTYSGTGANVPTQTGGGWVVAGSVVPITTQSPLAATADTRYCLNHWTSTPRPAPITDSTAAATTIVADTAYTLTAIYGLQYRFQVANPSGNDSPTPPVGDYWYFDGATVTASVTSPDVTTHQYCSGWTGTGSCASGSGPAASFVIHAPSGLTWNWGAQLTLTVVSAETGPNPVPTVGVHYYDPGAVVNLSTDSLALVLADTRYRCTGWMGTGSVIPSGTAAHTQVTLTESSTITWNYILQFRLQIANPSGNDTPNPPVGYYWFDQSAHATGSVTSPWTTYVCIGYSGTGSAPSRGYNSSFDFAMEQPSRVTWLWALSADVVQLTVTAPHGTAYPFGTSYHLPGTDIVALLDTQYIAPGIRWIPVGYTGTGSASSGTGATTAFTINVNSTLTWTATQQYRLVIENPGGHDSPTPAAGNWWYAPDVAVSGSVTSPDGDWRCSGYAGTGSAAPGSGATSFAFLLHDSSRVTWQWANMNDSTNRTLTVFSAHGTPNPSGTTTYARGATVIANVDTAVVDGGYRYVCVGWTGTGSVPARGWDNDASFVINVNSTLTWTWVREDSVVTLEVTSPYDTPWPPRGILPMRIGEVVPAAVDSIVAVGGHNYICTGWSGAGSVPVIGFDNNVTFAIMVSSHLDWQFARDDSLVSLSVTSPYGSPLPAGTTWHRLGTTLLATNSATAIVGGVTYGCYGYTGTGSVPLLGTGNWVIFDINQNSSVTWLWAPTSTLIPLTVNSAHGRPLPSGTTYYMPAAIVNAQVDSLADEAGGRRFRLLGWTGGGSTPSSGGTWHTTFPILVTSTLTWNWNGQFQLWVTYDRTTTGGWAPALTGSGWYDAGTDAPITASPNLGLPPNIYGFVTWQGFPTSAQFDDAALSTTTVRMDTNIVATATYGPAVPCMIQKVPAENLGDITVDNVVSYGVSFVNVMWAVGSRHRVSVTSPDGGGGGDTYRYFFNHWSDNADTHATDHITTPITGLMTIQAIYDQQVRYTLEKSPLTLIGDFVWNTDTLRGLLSATTWATVGTQPRVALVLPVVGDTVRWGFTSWSDGGAQSHILAPISGPATLTATLSIQFRVRITTSPAHQASWLRLGAVTTAHVSTIEDYYPLGARPMVGASEYDARGVDSSWIYDHWSDLGDIVHQLGPLLTWQDLTVYYTSQLNVLSVAVPDTEWATGLLDQGQVRWMTDGERLEVQNDGNIPCDFGLQIVADTGMSWLPLTMADREQFALRARFDHLLTAPDSGDYSWAYDLVPSSHVSWSTATALGPGGFDVLPRNALYPARENWESLWFRLESPTDTWRTTQRIRVRCSGKVHLE